MMPNFHYKKLFEWATTNQKLNQEIEKGTREYFKNIEYEDQLNAFYPDDDLLDQAMSRALEWVIFDRKLKKYNKTPLQLFLDTEDLTDKERQIFNFFQKSFVSLFEVKKIEPGWGLLVEDLTDHKLYQIKDESSTFQIKIGETTIARIIPISSKYCLLGSTGVVFDQQILYSLRFIGDQMSQLKQIDPRYWESFFQKKSESDKVWEELNQLDNLFGRANINVRASDIQLELSKAGKNPNPVINKYCSLYADKIETKELFNALYFLWQQTPQPAFGGKTPLQAGFEQAGPLEHELAGQCMSFIHNQIDWFNYWSSQERDKDIKKLERRFLDTPKAELDYKTPRQAILSEREQMGIDRKEIGYEINYDPIGSIEGAIADMHNQGVQVLQQGNAKKAFCLYCKIINLTRERQIDNPDLFRAWGNLGICYASLSNEKNAMECFRRALKLNPNYEQAQKNIDAIKEHGIAVIASNMLKASIASRSRDRQFEWAPKKLSKMKTDDIVSQFKQFIPEFSLNQFLEFTDNYQNYQVLAEDKYYPLSTAVGKDEDFIWMATGELWKRLKPDQPSIEHLMESFDDSLERADKLRAKGKIKKALEQEYQSIKQSLTKAAKIVGYHKSADIGKLQKYSIYDLSSFFDDFIDESKREKLDKKYLADSAILSDWADRPKFGRKSHNAKKDNSSDDISPEKLEQMFDEMASMDMTAVIKDMGPMPEFFIPGQAADDTDDFLPPNIGCTRKKVGRNDPCPCGALKPNGQPVKYKKCCGK